ncbi:probable oxidoreductase [Plesiocystis pacifica SIR-1]|uniref:Probable oxidoreductase n=1 Tax=Plesiocystis pacifica SIR-1 TaxID=391625 RepID=A6FYB4_9BACT|nr:SDR family NAD(P)-dependent oxidoreductase [Plesiocystis pacifica]EDM81493.1 probable oxidoreductase [Plesiocystis pacifica SIR-1]
MSKTILITGATSGIGFETAKALAARGHHLLVHGRSRAKLDELEALLRVLPGAGPVQGYVADLSRFDAVEAFAAAVVSDHARLDVLINNAGVFKTSRPITDSGHDLRFVVNTLAPLHLTQRLLPLLPPSGRIVNLSSAAQNPVSLDALAGRRRLAEFDAYAQSKLAITAWSRWLAKSLPEGPVVVAVNPGSLLATNMVREGFGVAGNDVRVGADILMRAALSEAFADASGKYFDNDAHRFGPPHPDALDDAKVQRIVDALERELDNWGRPSAPLG